MPRVLNPVISYRGQAYGVRVREGLLRDPPEIVQGQLQVPLTQHQQSQGMKSLQRKLISWYQSEALTILSEKSRYYADCISERFIEVKIGLYRSKWGSCSSKRILAYHWPLIMAPDRVIDYVVIHEVCHLAHLNHSKDFWRKVASLMPDYLTYQTWLKRHGGALQRLPFCVT